mmetsp:Transcript_76434/g.224276  ORF Transcript_76434/g.224276 Transcript_76434/m.224276 type:complete len:351 (-) Transcript_76434:3-1055(-)
MSTPLHAAILAGGHAQTVELALREGGTSGCCQVDAATGEFPLHAAARLGQSGTARRLMRCGASVDARTTSGMNATALHFAAANGHLDVLELLLAAGACPQARDARGRSAAYLAESAGHDAVAERLHDLRRKAGDYELTDIPHVAVKGLEGAAEGVRSFFTSLNPFADPGAKESQQPNGAGAAASKPQAQAPKLHPPSSQQAPSALSRVSALVDSVAQQARTGHLRDAAAWQDDLTKAACELDGLEVGSDPSARANRRSLISRIDEISNLVDERLATTAQALASSAKTISEVESRVRTPEQQAGRRTLEWRDRLVQVASCLDTIECATDLQRSERKALLARIDAAERELER